MLLGEFKSILKDAIKRGDSFDSKLDGYIRRAARWIEQNYTLQYMRKRLQVTSVAGADTLPLPNNIPLKTLEYLRFMASDGTRLECTKGELSDPEIQWWGSDRYSNVDAGARWPTHFYLDGVSQIIFNRAFSEALPGVGIMALYTDFPKADNQGHWLLRNAEGLLLRQSLLEFMTDVRDDRGAQAVLLKRQEDIQTLINAEYEMRYTGQDLSLGL